MTQFSIAQLKKNGKWVWKLVHYTHVYHRSPEFKTKASCEANLNRFWMYTHLAVNRKTYYCKEKQ